MAPKTSQWTEIRCWNCSKRVGAFYTDNTDLIWKIDILSENLTCEKCFKDLVNNNG